MKKHADTNSSHKKRKVRKEIYLIAFLFVLIFGVMIYSYVDFLNNGSKDFIYNKYNSRFSVFSDEIVRGNILTADGKTIATTGHDDEGNEIRLYPDERLFCHAVGYVGKGMAGLESQYSFDLLRSHSTLEEQINNSLTGTKSQGDSLVTTLDYETQKAAFSGMGLYDGAVIAIEPDTGKVVAMVSKPDYDPNTIDKYWDDMTGEDSTSSVLLNRATSAAYPPGSTFKIVTTIAYLRQHEGNPDYSFNCKGYFDVEDYRIHCSGNKAHGSEDLMAAFSNSCNSAYANIGVNLDRQEYVQTAEDLLMNGELPTKLSNVKSPKFSIDEDTEESIVAQTAIGQGQTSVSPIYMCMLVSAIANDGILMEPYIGDKIVNAENETVTEYKPTEYGRIMSQEETELLNSYMESVVMDGTAKKVDFGDLTVYGKTGTAEYTSDKSLTHSWFVGYAMNESGKKLAVAVIMEGAGYGSKYAAPLASKVFDSYFR